MILKAMPVMCITDLVVSITCVFFAPQTKHTEMKKLLITAFVAFIALVTTAQTTIGNANMESWTGVGSSTEEPTNFNSIKNGSGNALALQFAPQSCFRENSNPHGGTYCARILTGNALGQGAPGSMTTGRVMVPSTTASEGYIKTVVGDPLYSMPFVGRPDSLVVWYRYTKQGSDYPSITALLHIGNAYLPEVPVNNNHPDSSVNIIARAEWQGAATTVSGWTRISVPFVYVDSRTPQYILITLTSSANSSPTTNSTLWVDDFDVIYNPTIATGTISPLSYYVSATQGASVSAPYTLTGTFSGGNTITAELSDANGSFASPVTIGSVSSTSSGTISATIPANTATGTGYRIRVKSSSPALTATNNGSDISITLVGNSIAPTPVQTIGVNEDGTGLTVTETGTASSREWKYSTTSGSGYQSLAVPQTYTSYTPNFAAAGTYYLVCVSTFGSLTVTSNEVQINVVGNSIAPATSQSILVGVNGTQLTVTETPAALAREWKYSTTSGSGYQSFIPGVTAVTSYTPNFASSGTYYVICQSIISGVTVNSNEVLVSVGNATLSTGPVSGSPFNFSPSAPDATVNVSYTTSGTFNSGNVFTAQLSDANGSFTSPVTIGSVTATSSGLVNVTIPHTTPAGNAYRVRIVSSNPSLIGSDNGTDLIVDQFHNSIAPTATQSIPRLTNGTDLTATFSQSATLEWKYSYTSGGPYSTFTSGPETNITYTPYFDVPGTYYVVCIATNMYNDDVTSNEVQIDVANGSTLTTATVAGSPYDVSPSMNAPVSVNFTSDAFFFPGNVFTAQLSDYNGSFANPVDIGSLTSTALTGISANIPGNTPGGTHYRIRVVSTNPAITGSDNGTDLTVNPFEISVAPPAQQNINVGANGTAIAVFTTQSATYEWQHSDVQGAFYTAFNPAETGSSYTPHFNTAGTNYVVCKATNGANDVITSQDVTIVVTAVSGLNQTTNEFIKAYWNGNNFVVDLTATTMSAPVIELMNTSGQVVLKEKLSAGSLNTIATSLNTGMYVFKITDGENTYNGKTTKN